MNKVSPDTMAALTHYVLTISAAWSALVRVTVQACTVRILPNTNHHETSDLYFMGYKGQGGEAEWGMVSLVIRKCQ